MTPFVLVPKIFEALKDGFNFYWNPDYPYMELRAVTYTYENGTVRSKFIHLFNLKTQLRDIVLTQEQLGNSRSDFNSYYKILEEAYWKKIIPFHPGINDFLENSLMEQMQP